MELVVGIDLATAAVRVMAAGASGESHGTVERSLPQPWAPQPGWSEQDAGSWWPAVASALAELSSTLGDRARHVVALSVSATSATVVGMDPNGHPVGPALTYADQRAVPEAAAAQAAAADAWAAIGLTISPSFGLPKWARILKDCTSGSAPVARLGHASDVVVAALTGGLAATDTSHALKSGYDPVAGEWVEAALTALNIPKSLLPDVLPPGHRAGRLTREASRVTGLPLGCEVRLGMTDSCAAQLAAGAADPGRFVTVVGTTLVLKGASRTLIADPGGAVYSHRHPGGWWLPGGASSTGGRALAGGFPGRDLRDLDRRAAARGPAGCVIYPLVGRGERFPFAVPQAEGFQLGVAADEVERYRAVLEGVAFVERLGYERLRGLGAEPQGPVITTGGGSAGGVWNTIRSTLLGKPVEARTRASTALGACILAATGTLHSDLQTATAAMSVTGETFHPLPQEQPAMEQNYRRFLEESAKRGWIADRR